LLELATQENKLGPAIVTIIGGPGLGKTGLAAKFDKPFFIWIEDGSKSIDHDNASWMPNQAGNGPFICTTIEHVHKQINALLTEEHDYKTLVLDTVTQYNILLEGDVLARDPKAKSINQALGGYGAGHGAVANEHKLLRDLCERLKQEKGMDIVFIAHTEIETITPPDSDAYNYYTIRMNKKSIMHYSDNVDMVAHVQLQNFVRKEEDKNFGRAVSDGSRVIVCHASPSSICKNRYGIDQEIPFAKGSNPLKNIIKGIKV